MRPFRLAENKEVAMRKGSLAKNAFGKGAGRTDV